jgi:hypothetical protein
VRRSRVYIAIAFAVFVFAGISLLLARALTGASAERGAVLDLARAEARGDAAAVLAQLPACRAQPACVHATTERVAALKQPGAVQLLTYQPSVQVTLTRRIGTGRVAWRAGTRLPVVQCVRVRREGPLTGGSVALLSVSGRIGGEASCPR